MLVRCYVVQSLDHRVNHDCKAGRTGDASLNDSDVGDHVVSFRCLQFHLVAELGISSDQGGVEAVAFHSGEELSSVHGVEGFLEVDEEEVCFWPDFEGNFLGDLLLHSVLGLVGEGEQVGDVFQAGSASYKASLIGVEWLV